MAAARVLVLAGSGEAAALCARLVRRPGVDVLASFAGRVRNLRTLPCPVRVGGFGGIEGLTTELRSSGCRVLVDATHPFAAQMGAHAVAAADDAGVPRLRLLRPAWVAEPDDRWIEVGSMAEAVSAVSALGVPSVFLALGRNELDEFASLDVHYVVRSIDAPTSLPLRDAEVVLGRGPFSIDDEVELLRGRRVGVVVSRNSGGEAASAKLVAAQEVGIPVVMIDRPPPPPGPIVATVDDAERWVLDCLGRR